MLVSVSCLRVQPNKTDHDEGLGHRKFSIHGSGDSVVSVVGDESL